jgi:hypothetical protein
MQNRALLQALFNAASLPASSNLRCQHNVATVSV